MKLVNKHSETKRSNNYEKLAQNTEMTIEYYLNTFICELQEREGHNIHNSSSLAHQISFKPIFNKPQVCISLP